MIKDTSPHTQVVTDMRMSEASSPEVRADLLGGCYSIVLLVENVVITMTPMPENLFPCW